ncbi:MAG: preprotein translocase subunit SecG [Ketobacteraceae bacterium]|nr:preprotein translocase subunit SecG [Ketobacteraceae bacterium]
MIETVLLIGLVVIALAIIGLVLLQQGKGADMGASFGSGASQTLFGSQGSGNFLTKSTWTLSFVFFGVCLGLAMIARDKAENAGKIDFVETTAVEEVVVEESEIPAVEESAEDSDLPVAEDAPAESDVSAAGSEAESAPAAEAMQSESVSEEAAADSDIPQ